jgi:hypothetical protein
VNGQPVWVPGPYINPPPLSVSQMNDACNDERMIPYGVSRARTAVAAQSNKPRCAVAQTSPAAILQDSKAFLAACPAQGRNFLYQCKTTLGFFPQKMVNKSNTCWRNEPATCTDRDCIGASFYALCPYTIAWQVGLIKRI